MRWRLCLWKQKTCCLEKQNPRIGSPCTAMSGPGQRSPGLCSGGLPLAQQMPKREWSEPSPGKRTMTHTWSTKSSSGQAIGFAGVEEIAPHIYQDAGIALGPEYVGKGYGKQILRLLLEYCASTMGGEEFYYSTQAVNQASRALALSCWLLAPPLRAKDQSTKRRALRAGSLPQKTVGQTNHLFLPSPREIGNTAGRI